MINKTKLIRVEMIDDSLEVFNPSDMSDYQRKDPKNHPTHYIMETITEGEYKGFDQITYLKKKIN
jgi:predicted class III extradiol MEMO1 family dioxygenase